MPARPRSMPALARKLCLSAATLVVLLAGAELACRLLGYGAPREVADYVADWKKLRSTADERAAKWGTGIAEAWDGEFYVLSGPNINRDGLRDWDRPTEKPAGTLRIACLGDSVTHGFNVVFDDAFPTRLERQLRDKGVNAEVFNVALPGWSTRQQRIAYERIARKYASDDVLLGFCLNDAIETQNNLARPPALLAWAYRGSYLVRALIDPEEAELHRVEELFEQPESERVRNAWRLCFAEITALRDRVDADGASFTLVIFPFRFQVLRDAPEPIPQRVLRRFCEEQGIACVDTLEALREIGPQAFIDYDHLSGAGAARVARAIIDAGVVDSL